MTQVFVIIPYLEPICQFHNPCAGINCGTSKRCVPNFSACAYSCQLFQLLYKVKDYVLCFIKITGYKLKGGLRYKHVEKIEA